MTVLDASAVVELLLGTDTGRQVAELLDDPEVALHAPHLLDVEVTQVLRKYARDGLISPGEARTALDDLGELDIERHGHEPLLERMWELRENVTAYDAAYLALAEALDSTLLTCDRKLASTPGMQRRVRVVGAKR